MRLSPSSALAAPMLILLGSCVGPPSPRPVPPAPVPAAPARPIAPQTAPAPVATDWQYRPLTPGNWTYRADSGASLATFVAAGAAPRLTIRCDMVSRQVSFVRGGAGQGAMIIRTTYGAVSWPLSPAAAESVAVRAASDKALDQLAYSRGRFAVEVDDRDPLVLPAWAEVARVIEDCRG